MSTSFRNVDHVLTNYTFQEYYVAEVTQCLQKCLDNEMCVSFNFEYSKVGAKKCELNNSTRAWAKEKFQERLGFVYYD